MAEGLFGLDKLHNYEEGFEDEQENEPIQQIDLKPSFSTSIDKQEKCESILIIDGDYFEIGIKEVERLHPNQQCLSVPENIRRFVSFIESRVGVQSFDWKSFHTAEEPKSKKRKGYYSVFEQMGFNFDVREFKSKKVKWPNNNCQHAKKAFVTKVQAEVDVAITMTTMELLLTHQEVKNVVFVIGDRDFYDLFKYLKKVNINTSIFGFKKNLSGQFFNLFSPDSIFYINDYWNEIFLSSDADEFPPLTPNYNNTGEQRQINLMRNPSEMSKGRMSIEKEMPHSVKKKRKKKKNKNTPSQSKKVEEKKYSGYKEWQEVSHSSTDDSVAFHIGK